MMIEVIAATAEQEQVIANLLELYAHDFSEFHDIALGEDGRFGYPDLTLYWSDRDRHPFLVRVDKALAGFALVARGSSVLGNWPSWDVAEFFVIRKYRRRGVGIAMAREIWRRFPGLWEVRVMESNHAAHSFWHEAIAQFTGGPVASIPIEVEGKLFRLLRFETRRIE